MDQTDNRHPALVAFAERLVSAWQDAGHPSRSAAATHARTTGGYFARLCAGTVEPGITIVERLATAFDVEPAWLAYGTGPRKLGERPTESKAKKGKRSS